MFPISDIPDWTLSEALGINDYDPKFNIDAESYKKIAEKSPIKHIDSVIILLLVSSFQSIFKNDMSHFYR